MLRFGAAESRSMRCVALEWQQIDLDADALPADLPAESGLYSYQGCCDARPGFGVLYIGKASALKTRVPRSLCERLYWEGQNHIGLYSDVWQPRLHYAKLEESLLDQVESLLIAANAPPFNNQHVRTQLPQYDEVFPDLLVLNGGRKGALLPVACGIYFLPLAWPDKRAGSTVREGLDESRSRI